MFRYPAVVAYCLGLLVPGGSDNETEGAASEDVGCVDDIPCPGLVSGATSRLGVVIVSTYLTPNVLICHLFALPIQ